MVEVLWLANFRKELRQLKEQIAIAKEDLAHINAMLESPEEVVPFPAQQEAEARKKRRRA